MPEETLGPLAFPMKRFRGFAAFADVELGPGSMFRNVKTNNIVDLGFYRLL